MDFLITSFIQLLQFLINIYIRVIAISALLNWVNPDPYNPIVQILYKLSTPAHRLVSKIPTRIGSTDLAPLTIILTLWFANSLLGNLIVGFMR